MRFNPDFVEKVRQANNLVDIVGSYTQLRPNGSNHMGRCPFPDHNDKTASFSVSEDKQLYNCFGCKKSGNVFTFLQTYQGLSFPESIEYLAKRANIPLPVGDEDPKARYAREERSRMAELNQLSSAFFHNHLVSLPAADPVRVYCEKRGLSADMIEAFQIGFAPDEWHALTRFLVTRKKDLETAAKAGLVKKSNRPTSGSARETHYDLFRGRLMFPIVSTGGEVIAFGGRILESGEPKYLNSPETLLFHKGKVLFGLNATARHIRSEDLAVIVEGYMDALAMYRAGIKNVAAVLGTAFTQDHGKILSRMTSNVVMLLDGDRAGIQGAERSLPSLLASDLRARAVFLPEKMDPDEFLAKNGVVALKALIDGAQDLFTVLLAKHWMSDYRGTAADKVRVIERMAAALKPIANQLPDLKEYGLFVAETARYLEVPELWVRKTLGGILSSGPVPIDRPVPVTKPAHAASPMGTAGTAPDPLGPESVHGESEEAGIGSASGPFEQTIDIQDALREEQIAFGVLVQSPFLLRDLDAAVREWHQQGRQIEEHPLAQIFQHPGLRKASGLAIKMARSSQDKNNANFVEGQFAEEEALKVPARLLSLVAPQALFSRVLIESLQFLESLGSNQQTRTAESDRQKMHGVLRAIEKKKLQLELQALGLSLKSAGSPAESAGLMERFMEAQKQLRSLE